MAGFLDSELVQCRSPEEIGVDWNWAGDPLWKGVAWPLLSLGCIARRWGQFFTPFSCICLLGTVSVRGDPAF